VVVETLPARCSSSSSFAYARAACVAAGLLMLAGMFASGATLESRVRRALFASSQPGWMHVIHPAHLRANSDGSGVVAVGDPVGWIEDVSGNGNFAWQDTATARPLLQQDAGGHFYLTTDGADDWMQFAAVTATGSAGRVLALAGSIANPGTQIMISAGPTDNGNGYLGKVSTGWYYREGAPSYLPSGVATSTLATVIASVRAGTPHLQVNSTDFTTANPALVATWRNLFRYGPGASSYAQAVYYGGVLNVREPSAADVALVKRWLDKLRGA
jgi:hypothetical protein